MSSSNHPESAAPEFLGTSNALKALLGTIERVSRFKTNVLILGESGTGKELIARALHARGPRRQRPFIPVNCATLGRELLENELFGHEKGAFTGANEQKKGLFELADGGTLFLDEVSEMDPATQAKLLRVLERNEFRRVGGTHKLRVDVSVVAATNRDLQQAIAAGTFRADLYYRLKVVTLKIPPLRERREDIPLLVDAFVRDFNEAHGTAIKGLSPAALAVLSRCDWPGNVRELKNAVQSAAIFAEKDIIGPEAFHELGPLAPQVPATEAITVEIGTTLAEAERALIVATLARCSTRREAAELLGIGLRTLYTKLREYEIPDPPEKNPVAA